MKMYIPALIVGYFVVVFPALGQKSKKIPTADEVLACAVQTFSGVEDFSATIDVEVAMERMQIPPMHATMQFKRPDKVHFDSQGFLFLPKEGMVLNPSLIQERYSTAGRSIDTLEGVKHYMLLLVAKNQTTHLLRLNAWINAENWTIRKVETTPYEGRMLTLQFEYAMEEGMYWLLSKTVASFGSITGAQGQNEMVEMKKQTLDDTPKPPSRNGTVTIKYSNYKVNQGIDDSVFGKKEVQGKK
jgi:outer membrane lipoprotein-sorting protein